MAPQVWFITGTSTGFGRFMAECVLKNDGIVIATLRKAEAHDLTTSYGPDRLLIIQLYVSIAADIPPAFQRAIDTFGRIDVMFNNAGFNIIGEAEIFPEEEARRLFETNYWGAVNVSREAIRVFRDLNWPGVGGRLLQNSSMAGIGPIPLMSQYVATKHALEGFTTALALELNSEWNIQVTIIEAGFFQTELGRKAKLVPIHPTYNTPVATMTRGATAVGELPGDIEKGVAVIFKVAQLPEAPLHFPLGMDGVKMMKTIGQVYTETADKYASWSEDLVKAELGEVGRAIKEMYH